MRNAIIALTTPLINFKELEYYQPVLLIKSRSEIIKIHFYIVSEKGRNIHETFGKKGCGWGVGRSVGGHSRPAGFARGLMTSRSLL